MEALIAKRETEAQDERKSDCVGRVEAGLTPPFDADKLVFHCGKLPLLNPSWSPCNHRV